MQSVLLLSLSLPNSFLQLFPLCSGTHFSPSQISHWLRPHSTFSLFFWDSCHQATWLWTLLRCPLEEWEVPHRCDQGSRSDAAYSATSNRTFSRPSHRSLFRSTSGPVCPIAISTAFTAPLLNWLRSWQSKNFPLGSIKLPTHSHFPSPRLLKIPSTQQPYHNVLLYNTGSIVNTLLQTIMERNMKRNKYMQNWVTLLFSRNKTQHC